MDPGYITLGSVLIIGGLSGFFHSKREGQRGYGGWVDLAVLGVLIGGLIFSGLSGNESLTWIFGWALMVALPVMFLLGIGSVIGSLLRRDHQQAKDH